MLNKKYVRELVKNILSINEICNVYILNVINDKAKADNIKLYTVYINPRIYNEHLSIPIENIFPFTHNVESQVYQYNNISEEEINLLEEVLSLLGVNVSTISNGDLLLKKKTVSNLIDDVFKEICVLKEDISNLEKNNNMLDVYKQEKKLESIVTDLEKINVFLTI